MQKDAKYDLVRGNMFTKLLALSLPIMGGNLVQMAYNLADTFWLGRLGSETVAASGTVGIYMWLSMALMLYGNRGAEIGVAQSLGRGAPGDARGYAHSAALLSVGLGLAIGSFFLVLRAPLIGFFQIREAGVVADAEVYLAIISFGMPFSFLANAVMGCFSGSGNTMTPFILNVASLLLNIVLDPVLIFTAGLGIAGAALATVFAQAVNCLLLVAALLHYRHPAFETFKLWGAPRRAWLRDIVRWATPMAIESFLFTFFSMVISRFVAAFGAGAIAAQRIGTQIESLSWLVAGGFASAFTAYVGQNYGAGQWRRIHQGFKLSVGFMGCWSLMVMVVLLFGRRMIFAAFLPGEPGVIDEGARLLLILVACQLPQCLEPIAAGAYHGMGRTLQPSLISVLCNAARVALCWTLSHTAMGLQGIWWGLAIGSAARGLFTFGCYLFSARNYPQKNTK